MRKYVSGLFGKNYKNDSQDYDEKIDYKLTTLKSISPDEKSMVANDASKRILFTFIPGSLLVAPTRNHFLELQQGNTIADIKEKLNEVFKIEKCEIIVDGKNCRDNDTYDVEENIKKRVGGHVLIKKMRYEYVIEEGLSQLPEQLEKCGYEKQKIDEKMELIKADPSNIKNILNEELTNLLIKKLIEEIEKAAKENEQVKEPMQEIKDEGSSSPCILS